jgi:hypothetical protein
VGTVTEKVKDAAATVGEYAGQARETVQDWAATAGECVSSAAGSARDWATDAAGHTGEALGDFGKEATSLIRRYPVPALLIGFGVGFLLAKTLHRD